MSNSILCVTTDRFKNVIACPTVPLHEDHIDELYHFAKDTSNGKHPCFKLNKLNSTWATTIINLGFQPWFVNPQGDRAIIFGSNEERMIPIATHSPGVNVLVVRKPSKGEPMILNVEELYRQGILKNVTGCVDPDKFFHECVLKEIEEETGYKINFVYPLGFVDRGPKSGRMGTTDLLVNFLAFVQEPEEGVLKEPVPQETEIKCAVWVPFSAVEKGEFEGKKISAVTRNLWKHCIETGRFDRPGEPVKFSQDVFDPTKQCAIYNIEVPSGLPNWTNATFH